MVVGMKKSLDAPLSIATSSASPPVVRLVRATKEYAGGTAPVRALNNVTLDLQAAQFTAVMGPSGSGKSTLMNLAAGLDDVTHGECFLAGQPLHQMDDTQRTILRREAVGFIFQSFNLVPTLSSLENIELPFALANRKVDAETEAWIKRLVTTLGLDPRLDHRPAALSGGQQQRVAISRALASRPDIIFADEPTGNLDSRSGREVLALLRTAVTEYGQSLAMVTHDPVAASYADRIVVIADGCIVGDHGPKTAAQVSSLLLHIEERAAS